MGIMIYIDDIILIYIMSSIAAQISRAAQLLQFPAMEDFGNQCQLANSVILATDYAYPSYIQIVKMLIVFIIFIAVYTAAILYLGRRKTKDKMTMTPVTYTFVRGVKQPRFEYNLQIGGCWPQD